MDKQEVIKRWRTIGFLCKLKEGSINEWRCAKSYENMSNYLIENPAYNNDIFSVQCFAFIRRAICRGKQRLHRFIKPEEIIDFLTNTTMKELFEFVVNMNRKYDFTKLCENLLTMEEFLDYSIYEFQCGAKDDKITQLLRYYDGIIDIEAEVLVYSVVKFVEDKRKK